MQTGELLKGNTQIIVEKSDSSNGFKDILPVFTLILGIAINKILDYFTDRKKINKAGKRWQAELLSVSSPLDSQISNLKDALQAHIDDAMKPPKIISNAQLEGESFESLDKSDLLTFLNRYYRADYHQAVELSNRINFFVSITKSHKALLKKRFEEFIESYGKRHDKFNGNFQGLYKSLNTYAHQIKNNEGEDALQGTIFKPLDDLFREHVEPFLGDGKLNYMELDKNYLIPLMKELEKLSADPRVLPIMDYGRNCLDDIKGLKIENSYFSVNLNTIIDFFLEDKVKLEKILEDIDPKNKKRLWF